MTLDIQKDSSEKVDDLGTAEANLEVIQEINMHQDVDSHLDKKIDRKFDLHIVPWIFGIWSVICIIHICVIV